MRDDRSGDPQVGVGGIRTRSRCRVWPGYHAAGADLERRRNARGVGEEAAARRAVRAPRRDERREGDVEEVDRADVDVPALSGSSRIRLVRLHPLAVVDEVETGTEDIIGRPVFTLVARDVHRDVVEREVDEVDLVGERADHQVAVAAALAGSGRLRRKRRAEWHAKRLAEVGGLVEGAVPRLDEPLRRRDVDDVFERSAGVRIAIDDGRGLAAEPFVVDERGRREDVRRVGSRLHVATASAAARLVEQNRRVGYELDDVAAECSWNENEAGRRYSQQARPPRESFHVSLPCWRQRPPGRLAWATLYSVALFGIQGQLLHRN